MFHAHSFIGFLCVVVANALTFAAEPNSRPKPLFREFVGVNGHTVNFKPELYQQVCHLVRDYHPLDWDTGADTDYTLDFPFARNRVSWEQVYGPWKNAGFTTDACIIFDSVKPGDWKDLARDAEHYGRRFAASFGPSSPLRLVESAEIGNEPGKYSDAEYRTLFEHMASGIRAGDPKIKIATCNVNVGVSGDYHKSVECILDLEPLYDVLSVHTYAMLEQWPTWKRSYPEDERLPKFVRDIDDLIGWRDRHAPDKEIWVTEFGWDAATGKPASDGDFSKWQGNTELQQAQWLVRSFFLFATRDVQRAYIYFFNDDDQAQLHAASGLTRKYVPKPSFFAVGHLVKTLGDYRFARIVREEANQVCLYEFEHATDKTKRIWAAWSPTGIDRSTTLQIDTEKLVPHRAEKMPLVAGPAQQVEMQVSDHSLTISIGESPVYIFLSE